MIIYEAIKTVKNLIRFILALAHLMDKSVV